MQPLWASACAGACGCGTQQVTAYASAFDAGAALGGRRTGRRPAGRAPRRPGPSRSASGGLCRALSGHSVDAQVADKRRSLLRFVQDVQPHDALDHFQQTAPLPVAEAMRTTVHNLLGALPPAYFSVTVSANAEDLAQLLFSMLMTGYMYRNAQYRMDFDHQIRCSMDDQDALSFSSEPPPERRALPAYAAGSQLTRVAGSVLRWRTDTEQLEEVDARLHIERCEQEIASLREQLSRSMYARGSGNELLDWLRTQEPAALKELTEACGGAALEAMNSFVQRLLGGEMRRSESTAAELARIFFWALVTGYSLRQLEVKCDFEASFTVPTLPGALE